MERYIKEYASARIKDTKENELMQSRYKESKINKIERVLSLRSSGLITADEAIKLILEA